MPDYMFLMESRLSPAQRSALLRVQGLGQAEELNVYLTGGAVRDLISGMPIRDLDFTVQGNPARMIAALEKGGARIVASDDKLRHYELVLPGEVDGSINSAREEIYEYPGEKPEIRWSTIIEDLRRRDFSMNAIGISLNMASRGLLLDPTNGLADLEKREIRVLTMHSFTNQPSRLLRLVRFTARTGFAVEQRTQDWFDLAMERGLLDSVDGSMVGEEVRELTREENPVAVLKAWSSKGLLGAIHARLAKRLPDYDRLNKLMKVREAMEAAGIRPRLLGPVIHYTLGRLKSREASSALGRMRFRAAESREIGEMEKEAVKVVKMLKGRKTSAARDAYYYLEQVPPYLLAFVQVETRHAKVLGKIRNYLGKWRPLRAQLPAEELAALGVPRGPKFDKILLDLFHMQLNGKARNPTDRTRVLRQLAGIKPEPRKPKVVEPPEKPAKAEAGKKKGKAEAPPAPPVEKAPEAALAKGGKKPAAAPAAVPAPAPVAAKVEPAKKPEPAKSAAAKPAPKSAPKPAKKPAKKAPKKKHPARKPAKKPARKPAKKKAAPKPKKKTSGKKPAKRKSR